VQFDSFVLGAEGEFGYNGRSDFASYANTEVAAENAAAADTAVRSLRSWKRPTRCRDRIAGDHPQPDSREPGVARSRVAGVCTQAADRVW
jgi:hypothetical protein